MADDGILLLQRRPYPAWRWCACTVPACAVVNALNLALRRARWPKPSSGG